MTDLEQRANDEARHAHRELIEQLTERAETAEARLAEVKWALQTLDADPAITVAEHVGEDNRLAPHLPNSAKIKGETNDE